MTPHELDEEVDTFIRESGSIAEAEALVDTFIDRILYGLGVQGPQKAMPPELVDVSRKIDVEFTVFKCEWPHATCDAWADVFCYFIKRRLCQTHATKFGCDGKEAHCAISNHRRGQGAPRASA